MCKWGLEDPDLPAPGMGTEMRYAFLLQLTDTLHALREPRAVQTAAVQLVGEHFHPDRVFYVEPGDETQMAIQQDYVEGVSSLKGSSPVEFSLPRMVGRLRRGEALVISDVESDPNVSDAEREAFRSAQIASSAVVSFLNSGRWVAALGAHSATPREWTPFEIDLLKEAAGRTWTASEGVRAEAERRGARAALAEKDALLGEVHHRFKNHLQLVISLMSLQENQMDGTQALAAFAATKNRVYSIATVYDFLHRSRQFATMDLVEYARKLGPELVRLNEKEDRIQVRVEGETVVAELGQAVPFGLLLNELVSNSLRHGFPGKRTGEVTVRVSREGDYNVLSVADNGTGLPPQFEYQKAATLGLQLVHMLAQQLGGDVEVIAGAGTVIHVRFPVSTSSTKKASMPA